MWRIERREGKAIRGGCKGGMEVQRGERKRGERQSGKGEGCRWKRRILKWEGKKREAGGKEG